MEGVPQIFSINLSNITRFIIIIISSIAVFIFFFLHEKVHEILRTTFLMKDPFFLAFTQFIIYILSYFTTFLKIIFGKRSLTAPFFHYLLTSLIISISLVLAHFASVRLSSSAVILFRSPKLILVMIGNIVLLKKNPNIFEAVSICIIVFGLIGLSIGEVNGKNKVDLPGIVAIMLSLTLDSISSNLIEKSLSIYGASQEEVISVNYGLGSFFIGLASIFSGDFSRSINKILINPIILKYLFYFSIFGAIGIQFIYLLIKLYGSLTTVIITSIRKTLNIIITFFLIKNKSLTGLHLSSFLILSLGITLNIIEKSSPSKTQDDEKNLFHSLDNSDIEENNFVLN